MKSLQINLTSVEQNVLLAELDVSGSGRIVYDEAVERLCGDQDDDDESSDDQEAHDSRPQPRRRRIHRRKASLLGFTGDEDLHREYEKQRIEHRGGTHDIPEANGRGGYNTWDAKNYSIEEQIELREGDNRSYYQRNRRGTVVSVPLSDEETLEGRIDVSLLSKMMSDVDMATSSDIVHKKKKKKKKMVRTKANRSRRKVTPSFAPPRHVRSKQGTTSSRRRRRLHMRKAELLGFTGNQDLHREYEKQRIEHRGGTHDIPEADGRGGYNTWDAKNFTIEEQVELGKTDNRSYYQRNRRGTAVSVPTSDDTTLQRRVDFALLQKLSG